MVKRFAFKIVTLLVLMFSTAGAYACDTRIEAVGETDADCTQVGHIEFDIALGYGVRESPIVTKDDSNIILIPVLRYYGDNLFFDGGNLGYTLFDGESVSFNAITGMNPDAGYFSSITGSNDDKQSSASDVSVQDEQANQPKRSIFRKELDRDWALDAGVELNWYLQDFQVQAQWMRDVSSTHKGNGVNLLLSKHVELSDFRLFGNFGVIYKDQKWVDYYFGVRDDEVYKKENAYKGEQSLSPYTKWVLSHQVSDSWSWLASLRVEKLGNGISDSPAVSQSMITQWFTGMVYQY